MRRMTTPQVARTISRSAIAQPACGRGSGGGVQMKGVRRSALFIAVIALLIAAAPFTVAAPEENRPGLPTSTRSPLLRQVDKSIARGVKYLLENQNADGSWGENNSRYQVGQTSVIMLSLLSCGESHQSPKLAKTVAWLKT